MQVYTPFEANNSYKKTLKIVVSCAIFAVACIFISQAGTNTLAQGASVRRTSATGAMYRQPASMLRANPMSKAVGLNRNIFANAFALPDLPWEKEALKPHMSPETIDYHYGKHHAAYVNKLNDLTKGTDKESKTLEELIKSESGVLFNQAAQSWNHEFFWNCLSPNGGGEPSGDLATAINRDFGSFAAFKEAYDKAAVGHFGSGWIWLVADASGKLSIVDTHDAQNPMTDGLTPIITTDVWEHAYYIDYRNARPKYISDGWWSLVNWEFAGKNFAAVKNLAEVA